MSVWIGVLGGMVQTPCLSGLEVSRRDRSAHGGGPGTLAQPRTVVWGQAAREWSCALGARRPGDLASLETLAHLQHTRGGAYRMLACEAHHTNAFTPAASVEFDGWSGSFTLGSTYSTLVEEVDGGTVLLESTPLDEGVVIEAGYGPAMDLSHVVALTVTPATTATVLSSPVVPVIPGQPVTLGVFALGEVTVSAQWVDAAAADLGAAVALGTATHTDLRRFAPSATVPAGAHGVRLVVSGGSRYAWPSVTWTPSPRRYATGRGAESVVLSPVDESVVMATARLQLSGFRYVVREVPA